MFGAAVAACSTMVNRGGTAVRKEEIARRVVVAINNVVLDVLDVLDVAGCLVVGVLC